MTRTSCLRNRDADEITGIFNHYVVNATASFQKSDLRLREICLNIRSFERAELPHLVIKGALDGSTKDYPPCNLVRV